jgi:hypothetical protein
MQAESSTCTVRSTGSAKRFTHIAASRIGTALAEELLVRMFAQVDEFCAEHDRLVGQCRITKPA